ncbi:MAG TPA: hypothetical protein VMW10_08050 [Alphaproteobacteria bacterium]|nr:hypothetical protein [Alphaproteobacteria bacterium]
MLKERAGGLPGNISRRQGRINFLLDTTLNACIKNKPLTEDQLISTAALTLGAGHRYIKEYLKDLYTLGMLVKSSEGHVWDKKNYEAEQILIKSRGVKDGTNT